MGKKKVEFQIHETVRVNVKGSMVECRKGRVVFDAETDGSAIGQLRNMGGAIATEVGKAHEDLKASNAEAHIERIEQGRAAAQADLESRQRAQDLTVDTADGAK